MIYVSCKFVTYVEQFVQRWRLFHFVIAIILFRLLNFSLDNSNCLILEERQRITRRNFMTSTIPKVQKGLEIVGKMLLKFWTSSLSLPQRYVYVYIEKSAWLSKRSRHRWRIFIAAMTYVTATISIRDSYFTAGRDADGGSFRFALGASVSCRRFHTSRSARASQCE